MNTSETQLTDLKLRDECRTEARKRGVEFTWVAAATREELEAFLKDGTKTAAAQIEATASGFDLFRFRELLIGKNFIHPDSIDAIGEAIVAATGATPSREWLRDKLLREHITSEVNTIRSYFVTLEKEFKELRARVK